MEFPSYKLLCCTEQQKGKNKLWQRDNNAAKNILKIMCLKLTGKDLGVFKKKVCDCVQKCIKVPCNPSNGVYAGGIPQL